LYKILSYNFIFIDKLAIEVIKDKKELNPFYGIKGFLVIDYFNIFRINFNSIYSNNKPKVLYIFYSKFVFLNMNLIFKLIIQVYKNIV